MRKLDTLFRWVIDDQYAVNTGIKRRRRKVIDTHGFNRIGVAHQDYRCLVVVGPEVRDHAEHLPQTDTLEQGALRGALDGRPIGHRIGKWHTELDDVRPGFDQGVHQRYGQRGIGIASGNEGNQRFAPLRLQALEGGLYF